VKEVLRKLLKKRLQQPHLPGSELHRDLRHCYKIKLRQQGYRLVYHVQDDVLVVLVWRWPSGRTWRPTARHCSACCQAAEALSR